MRGNSVNVMLLCLNPTRHDEYLHILDSARTFKNITRTPLIRNRVIYQDEKAVIKNEVNQGLSQAQAEILKLQKDLSQLHRREQLSKDALESMQQEYEAKLRD